MAKEEALLAGLRSAGIPREAIATTLVRVGRGDIRGYITDRRYEEAPVAILIDDELLNFYLLAKEMHLSGRSAFCCSLADIHAALFSEKEEFEYLRHTLDSADVIAIPGFYEVTGNSAQFMDNMDIAYFRSWMNRRLGAGTVFILQWEADITIDNTWWPWPFVKYLRNKGVVMTGVSNE